MKKRCEMKPQRCQYDPQMIAKSNQIGGKLEATVRSKQSEGNGLQVGGLPLSYVSDDYPYKMFLIITRIVVRRLRIQILLIFLLKYKLLAMLNSLYAKMDRIWALMGRGCPPSTRRNFWVIFEKIFMLTKIYHNHETLHRPENPFVLESNKNKGDAYRYHSNFDGRMTSPSSLWSPIVKQKSFDKKCRFYL